MKSEDFLGRFLAIGTCLSGVDLELKFESSEDFSRTQIDRNFVIVFSLQGEVVLDINGDKYQIPSLGLACYFGVYCNRLYLEDNNSEFVRVVLPYSLIFKIIDNEDSIRKLHLGKVLFSSCCLENFYWFLKKTECYLESCDVKMHRLLQDEFIFYLRRELFFCELSNSPRVYKEKDILRRRHLRGILVFINENYQRKIKVSDVSSVVGIEACYSRKLFKQKMGIPMMVYVKILRLNHARYLLRSTSLDVIDIAFDSGFSSISRFYEVFSEGVGMAPLCYRGSEF